MQSTRSLVSTVFRCYLKQEPRAPPWPKLQLIKARYFIAYMTAPSVPQKLYITSCHHKSSHTFRRELSLYKNAAKPSTPAAAAPTAIIAPVCWLPARPELGLVVCGFLVPDGLLLPCAAEPEAPADGLTSAMRDPAAPVVGSAVIQEASAGRTDAVRYA